MARLYENFLMMVHNRDAVSICPESTGGVCANERCDRRLVRGEQVWRVSANRSDGWVIRHGEVHPECGETMPLYGITERVNMQREAVARRNARRANAGV